MMRTNTLTTILQQYHVENADLVKALVAVGEGESLLIAETIFLVKYMRNILC